MPQLQVEFFLPQIFWMIVIYCGLYFAMKMFVLSNVRRTIGLRKDKFDLLKSSIAEKNKLHSSIAAACDEKLQATHREIEKIRDDVNLFKKQSESFVKMKVRAFSVRSLEYVRKQMNSVSNDLDDESRAYLLKSLVTVYYYNLTGVYITKEELNEFVK